MARIVNKVTSTTVDVLRVNSVELGPVMLVDEVRPMLDRVTGDHLRSKYSGLPVWVATLMVTDMESRDIAGGTVEMFLRIEAEHVEPVVGPCFVEVLGKVTVTATNARDAGERKGRMTLKAEGIRQTDVEPGGIARSGLPVILPETLRFMSAAPAKGFGGKPRTENEKPVYVVQLLADEPGVKVDADGQIVDQWIDRRPLSIEVIGDPRSSLLRPLGVVRVTGAGVQVQADEFGRSARLTITATQVLPVAEEVPSGPVVSRGRARGPVAPVPVAEPSEVSTD